MMGVWTELWYTDELDPTELDFSSVATLSPRDDMADEVIVNDVSESEVKKMALSDLLAGLATDEQVKVSSDDTTAGYLEDKLTAGEGNNSVLALELFTQNPGADEDRLIQFDKSKVDHDGLLNTHNLTSDIDHDSITNTHNLTTDIDHDQITNTHNLTTDIDHDTIANTHNLTTDIDHGSISGLDDDDHEQYLLADGSRELSADWDAGDHKITSEEFAGWGIVPIGSVIAFLKSFTGTPTLPDGYVECNGQVLSDSDSVYNGQTMPNINSSGTNRFLRGATTSGGIGGSPSHNHSFLAYRAGVSLGLVYYYFAANNSTYYVTIYPKYYEVVYVMRVK